MGGHHILLGVAVVLSPIVLGSQAMTDLVGEGDYWPSEERASGEVDKASVGSEIASLEVAVL